MLYFLHSRAAELVLDSQASNSDPSFPLCKRRNCHVTSSVFCNGERALSGFQGLPDIVPGFVSDIESNRDISQAKRQSLQGRAERSGIHR